MRGRDFLAALVGGTAWPQPSCAVRRAVSVIGSKFGLALNVSTAAALGLTIPASFLALTDEVIE